jgi:hypothetical protein
MRKLLELSKRASADRNIVGATMAERVLGTAELDKVAAGGGKTGASSNPVED